MVSGVRLLTFNTLFKGDVRARLQALGAVLEADDYDIVCLQEVMYRRNIRFLRQSGRHSFSSGSILLRGGLVLLSRWPITRQRFIRYPVTAPLRPEMIMRKGAQLASIATPGGELTVVNTHLSANRSDDWSPGNRYTRLERAELAHLTEHLAAIDPAAPLVMVGDLNVPRNSSVFQDFIATAGLRDAMAGDTRPTYRPTPKWPTPPAFDHVLTRGPLHAEADLILQDLMPVADGRSAYLSDHFAVAATLTRPA